MIRKLINVVQRTQGKKINEHKGSLPKRLNYNKEPNKF